VETDIESGENYQITFEDNHYYLTIKPEAVTGYALYRVKMTFNNNDYTNTFSVYDETDPL
jgi:hypothetical protein